ncbi:MAG: hypothetical protein H7Z13_12675 [Ferruginibacter sp.]|nr:hypothetical protein [Ferruginibacter sp.]
MQHKIFFVFFLLLSRIVLHAQTINDVEKIKERLYNLGMERSSPVESAVDQPIDNMFNSMDASGKWPDIDYQDKTASKWLPASHWKRLLELSIQYRDTKSPHFNNDTLRNTILTGIGYWLKLPPQASNYWWNAIGVPNLMGSVYILMEKDLNDRLKSRGIELIKLGVKPTHYEYYGKATGQNLLWLASAHLYAACLSNDIEGVKRVFASVGEEIKITEEEGIQPDFSFYQHGKQNYAMGYGKGFTASAAKYFYLANQTAFQFTPEKIAVISHYLLDGQQWMSRYGYLEYTAMGREIARKDIDRTPLTSALKWMMDIDKPFYNEYLAFYRRLSGIKEEKPLVGNRYFWRSDLMVHQREKYYFSLKATSDRISSGESGNGENIKGFYQGNGTYYLVRTGHEYDDIFPVWDWRKLPGLLTKQTAGTFPLFTWGTGSEGNKPFVYGISDSLYGCFGYDYDKENVTARRSWFFFDNEIVHLANSINGDTVYQSINQSLLNGKVWTSNLNSKNPGNQMAFHDSVGYCISPIGNDIYLKTTEQTGTWKEINLSASAASISKKVFSLGIDLGTNANNAAFSYTIIPAVSLDQFKKYNLTDHVVILQNNNSLQAVHQKDIEQVQAVFFSSGTVELPWDNISLQMKQPGLALIKKVNNKLVIDYSQPFPTKHIEIILDNKIVFVNNEIEIRKKE